MNLPFWIVAVQWVSRAVLVLLAALSVWSVATMIRCRRLLRESGAGTDLESDFAAVRTKSPAELRAWLAKRPNLPAQALHAALELPQQEASRIDRFLRSFLLQRKTILENGLTTLATLGSNAPFIGLFGTVLGVIQAFGVLGANQSGTAQIMVGISEALVATAVGLFVAIPAVIAFNVFSRQLRVLIGQSEALRDLYLANHSEKGH